MPVFTVETPGGKKLKIEAADQDAALAGAQEWHASNDGSKRSDDDVRQSPAYTAARETLGKQPNRTGIVDFAALPLPWNMEAGGIEAAKAWLHNSLGGGKEDVKARYLAGADDYDAKKEQYSKDHPGRALFATIGGAAVASPMSEAKALAAGVKLTAPVAKAAVTGIIPKALQTAKTVATGAALGGAYAGAEGATRGTGGQRLTNAIGAVPAGMAFGAGGALVLPPILAGAGALVRSLAAKTPLSRVDATIARTLARDPIAAADLQAKLAGLPKTSERVPFEAGGENLKTLAEVVAQHPGPARAAAIREIGPRSSQTARDRLVRGVSDITNTEPSSVADRFASRVANLRDEAAPLYREAYAMGAVDSPTLQNLAQRPSGREAIKRAYQIAKEEGVNPEALGLTEVPFENHLPQPDVHVPTLDPMTKRGLQALRRGEKINLGQGPTLLEKIARGGGISDYGGELRIRDAEIWHRKKPFMNKLVNPTGGSADRWAQRAADEGYFGDLNRPATEEDLYHAISEELAGKPRYGRAPDPEAEALKHHMEGLEQELRERGIDPRHASDQDIAEAFNPAPRDDTHPFAPNFEPAFTTTPTARTWDFVKRGMDDVVERYRDPLTRRLNLDDLGRAAVKTRYKLRDELTSLNPAYKDALEAGGEPLRLERAFQDVPKLASNSVSERVFGERWGKAGEAEKDALREGWINHAFEQAQAGRLRVTDIQTPVYRSKLETMFGKDAADQIQGNIAESLDMLATKNQVLGGPATSRRLMAKEDLDRGDSIGGDLAEMGMDAITGSPIGAGRKALRLALKRLPRKDRSLLGDQETNAALGDVLFGRDGQMRESLRRILAEQERRGARAATRTRFGAVLGGDEGGALRGRLSAAGR